MDLYFQDGQDCPLLTALQPEIVTSGVNLTVSGRDEMFRLFHYGRGEERDLALHLYLESGKKIWRTLRRVLEWRFGEISRVGSLLDFAAGYGRVTRFTVADLPAERVWVSEIDPEAVRFQGETFGVHGLVSTTEPSAFSPGRDFDAILVSSLFTHLPEARFAAWLARLTSLLRPGGLLAFSVHDVSVLATPTEVPYLFRPESESGSLASSEYGSTWVTAGYVRDRLAEIDRDLAVRRIPRGLANYQDLYVVTRGAGEEGSEEALLALRGGAEGFLESCYVSAGRGVEIQGWVTDRFTRRQVREVRAEIGGSSYMAEIWDRPEIAAVFPGDARGGQGWRVRAPLLPEQPLGEIPLRLVAVGADGFEVSLFAGTLLDAIAQVALKNLLEVSRENAVLTNRIEGMRASRFWKLREGWFALKRQLGLTNER